MEWTPKQFTTDSASISATGVPTTVTSLVNMTMETVSNFSTEVTFNSTTEVTSQATQRTSSSTLDPVFIRFSQLAYFPVTALGLLGNVMSFWVWQAETTYNSTVFLLMALALWDALYCLCNVISYSLVIGFTTDFNASVPAELKQILNIFTTLTQVCSVNSTLASSATRLAAVYRPATFNLILSKPRMAALCVAIFLWGLLLISPDSTWRVCEMIGGLDCSEPFRVVSFYRENFVFDYLAFCVPILLLLLCNMATVFKVRQQQRGMASFNQKRGDRARRLSITMMTISLTSLLSYPVSVTVRLGLNPRGTKSISGVCDSDCYYMAIYCSALLNMLNSSVNFVFYCAISSRFVELLRPRMNSLLRLCILCRIRRN